MARNEQKCQQEGNPTSCDTCESSHRSPNQLSSQMEWDVTARRHRASLGASSCRIAAAGRSAGCSCQSGSSRSGEAIAKVNSGSG